MCIKIRVKPGVYRNYHNFSSEGAEFVREKTIHLFSGPTLILLFPHEHETQIIPKTPGTPKIPKKPS